MNSFSEEYPELINLLSTLTKNEVMAIQDIVQELIIAKEKHPKWPKDWVHRAAIVQEEAGELIRAALQHEYEDAMISDMEEEAIQTGAMAIRFLSE